MGYWDDEMGNEALTMGSRVSLYKYKPPCLDRDVIGSQNE